MFYNSPTNRALRNVQLQCALNVLQLDSRDNVLIALTDLKAGERVEFGGQTYTLLNECSRQT